MIEPYDSDVEIADECDSCGHDKPLCRCVEHYIGIGELSRISGVPAHKIRKWAEKGLIPHLRREGEYASYPEHQARAAIKAILKSGSRGMGKDDPSRN